MENTSSFVQSYTDFVQKTILEPLSTEAKNKGWDWPVEEMLNFLSLPSSVKSDLSNANSSAPLSAPIRKTKVKKIDENYVGPKCEYKFKRGKRIGEICNMPVVAGSKYCQHCMANKSVSNVNTTKPKVKAKTVENDQQDEEPAIDAEILDAEKKLYKENRYNLVIKNVIDEDTGKEDELCVVGILDNGKIRNKLTPAEVEQANSLKLTVPDEIMEKPTIPAASVKANIPKNIGSNTTTTPPVKAK